MVYFVEHPEVVAGEVVHGTGTSASWPSNTNRIGFGQVSLDLIDEEVV